MGSGGGALLLRISWLWLSYLMLVAGNSNSRYNAYHYDMTTPQFTPDGRLLQVEYASAAADHSSPLVVVAVQDTLVLVTIKSSTTQDRLVLWNDKIVIAMSGVLADSIALLQVVAKESTQQSQLFQTSLSLHQVASAIANACQEHSFGGGIRPFGSTMLICGVVHPEKLHVIQTDPSGAMMDVTTFTSNNRSPWIVGGTTSLQRQLGKQMEQAMGKKSVTTIADAIVAIGKTLIVADKSKQSKDSMVQPLGLEVVVISPTRGAYRLTKAQSDYLWKQVR